eukprot:Colp12_sorted_trinity150504_noHs@6699
MDCISCFRSAEERRAREHSKQIDDELKENRKLLASRVKLLLLGAGEAGKSTLIKQMKVIHSDGFSMDDRIRMRSAVYDHIISSMKAMVEALSLLNIALKVPENFALAQRVIDLPHSAAATWTEELGSDIELLWRDEGIQQCYERSNKYQLTDNTKYFMDALGRIKQPAFLPTQQDIINVRVQTSGIFETKFSIGTYRFHMVDVGGQRSERRKWLQCFSDTTAIIFIVAISEYDQVLREDNKTNRLREALSLFGSIWTNKWLDTVSIILFQNKIDLFEIKIQKSNLADFFPEYDGGPNPEAAMRFIESKFIDLGKPTAQKRVYPHHICAIDTQIVDSVFKSAQHIILTANLRYYGFI